MQLSPVVLPALIRPFRGEVAGQLIGALHLGGNPVRLIELLTYMVHPMSISAE